jgi:hypothetical protein
MASGAAAPGVEDTGLDALILLLRFHEIDPAQIRHQYGEGALPALAQCRDGNFVILGKAVADTALIQDSKVGGPEFVARADFDARCNGQLVLIVRRAALGDPRARSTSPGSCRRSTSIAAVEGIFARGRAWVQRNLGEGGDQERAAPDHRVPAVAAAPVQAGEPAGEVRGRGK